MSRRISGCLGAILLLGVSDPAQADQLACNSEENARRAVALLPAGSVMIDFCSLCSARIEVVRVEAAEAVRGCDWEVRVTGTLLAASERTFHDHPGKRYRGRARFRPEQGGFARNVDLAYVYVEVEDNRFRWLGGVLGLQAEVRTAEIRLPKKTWAGLGTHRRPGVAPGPAQQAGGTRLSDLGFAPFRRGPLARAARAFDRGEYGKARAAALRALTDEAGVLRRLGPLRDVVPKRRLVRLLEGALRERLQQSFNPLRNIGAGRALMAIEDLPPRQLERVVAALAAWAAATAHEAGSGADLQRAAQSLLLDPFTVFDLQRRAPRAALLARFYAALCCLAMEPRAPASHDLELVTGRLHQQLSDGVPGFEGNYAEVLGRLLPR